MRSAPTIECSLRHGDYVRVGEVSEALVMEVAALAQEISEAARQWFAENYAELLP